MKGQSKCRQVLLSLLLLGTAGLIGGIGAAVGIGLNSSTVKSNTSPPSHHISGIILDMFVEGSCDPKCMNGGSCGSDNVCQCTSMYTGATCNVPVCNPLCANGNCTAPQICTCQSGWSGSLCDQGKHAS